MIEIDTLLCSKCGAQKPKEAFQKRKANTLRGYKNQCKECDTKDKFKYNRRPEVKERTRELRKKQTARIRERYLSRTYSIDYNTMEQMFLSQDGKCAICLCAFHKRRDIHVDHNHSTGQVRQLLCRACNNGIGNFNETPTLMERAIEYVKKWNSPSSYQQLT